MFLFLGWRGCAKGAAGAQQLGRDFKNRFELSSGVRMGQLMSHLGFLAEDMLDRGRLDTVCGGTARICVGNMDGVPAAKYIQRGAKETKEGPKEFLREANIESMMSDIENNRFECPQLMWNLRAGEGIWVYITSLKELRVYQGVATRPDTNHRHHAIVRFHKKYLDWVEKTESTEMAGYNPDREYSLTIYTDDYQQEAHRFYVYNFKGWRVSTSTAHYIESKTNAPALHAKLARMLMERSGILGSGNVEIMGNTLSRNSAKMVTFGTLTDGLRTAFPGLGDDELDATLD